MMKRSPPVSTEDKQYVIRLNGKQMKALSETSELITRLHMGQLDVLFQFFYRYRVGIQGVQWERVRPLLETLKADVFPDYPRNGGPNLRNEKTPENARILYDLHQVLSHRLSWDGNPEGGMGVNFQDPLRTSGEALPEVIQEIPEESNSREG